MSKAKKITVVILLLILGAGSYVYKEYNRKNKDLGNVAADLNIQATDLIKKFEKDEGEANKTFMSKKVFVIGVTGPVKEVVKDEKGYYTIVVGDTTTMSSVRCAMDSVHQEGALLVRTGDKLTIQGAITGFNKDELLGSDVILNRCVIVNKTIGVR